MTFTVTYRSADGSMRDKMVDAASRAECLALMRTQGITPTSVKENGSRDEKGKRDRRYSDRAGHATADKRAVPYVLAVAFVVLVGGIWLWKNGADEAKETKEPPAQRKVAPLKRTSPSPRHVETPRPAKTDEAGSTPPPQQENAKAASESGGTVVSVRTNDNNLIITTVVDSYGNTNLLTTPVHEPVFSNPSDQLIAAVLNGTADDELPPLPPMGSEVEVQFKEAMKREIPDAEGDSDIVRQMKHAVREARSQIMELLNRGATVKSIIEEHRNLWNENVKIRDGVKAEYHRILGGGDVEGATEYIRTMNVALGQMGIAPISERQRGKKKRKVTEDEK